MDKMKNQEDGLFGKGMAWIEHFLKDPAVLEKLKASSLGLPEEALQGLFEKAKENVLSKIPQMTREELPESVWPIADKTGFCIAMMEALEKKSDYGDKPEALTPEERIFYIVELVEMEVQNGGFHQYFFNSSGDWAGEMVEACRAIGAPETAEICQKALNAIGCPLPKDREERIRVLERVCEGPAEEVLEACDDAFCTCPEDREALAMAFARNNREAFPVD